MMVKAGSILALAAVLTVSANTSAEAALLLRLTQGAFQVEIEDNEAGLDSNGAAGTITYDDPIGNYFIQLTTGVEGQSSTKLTLNSAAVSNAAGGVLKIEFTSTDNIGATSFSRLDINGFADNSIVYEAFWDPANAVFAQANQIATTLGNILPGPFAASTVGAGFGAAAPYSITQVVDILHTTVPFGASNFEATLIPEPAMLSLFGLGLVGLGLATKRRRAKLQANGLV
jgi:hypothetical protein